MSSCPGSSEGHVCRNGYYLGSTADYVCLLCGAELEAGEMDPRPTEGRSPFQRAAGGRRRRPIR